MVFITLALVIHRCGGVREVLVDHEVSATQQETLLGNLLGPGATESRVFCITIA